MVVAASDFGGDLEGDRMSSDRFICDATQQQDANFCVADTGRKSLESGCPVHKLERPICVCVSSDSINRPSVEQDSAIQVSDSVNSTNVAKTSVVSAATGVIDREANKSTSMAVHVEATEVVDKTRESTDAQFTCVDLIKRRWREKGFSETAADRMARAQKESSQAVYQGKWRIFIGWCEQRKVDPLQVSLIEVADFLVYLHEEKKLPKSTIEGYMTAIGHVLRAVGVDMMEGQALSTLMANIARDVKDKPKVPSWDCALVLETLNGAPFEPLQESSLKCLMLKMTFLLALASVV